MKLYELSPAPGTHKDKKRRGRGNGSGRGTTSGRGAKGQNARSGGGVRPGFEGGQMPIQRRLPKRGFTNISKKQYSVVNIRDLSRFDGSEVVDQTVLVRAGLVQGRHDGIKLLGQGTLDRPLTVRVHKVSKSALEKVLQAGGKVETA